MTSFIKKIFALSLLSIVLFSCEKDEERVILRQGTAPALAATSETIVLSKDAADQDAVTFTWTPSDYGFSAAVEYTLEADKKGNNFAEPKTVELANNLQKKYTVAELNSLLGQMELTPGSAGEVEIRIKSEVAPSVEPVYSNVLTLTATPYLDIIEYPSLYVPGSYQDWKPAEAAKVSSVNDDKTYEGYVNFPDAVTKFKFTSAPNWDNVNYGDAGAGKISATGGDLTVTGPGYYLLKVNLNDNTWSATNTNWGVIGSATAGGWDADQDLTYDAAAKVWKATLNLTPGEMKFRANDDWAINMGDNKPANSLLKYGGENIPIAEAGQYEIILNLANPGNYTYTVTKM